MARTFGDVNPALTRAIRRVSAVSSANVSFTNHAEDEMDNDGFDHSDALTCLRRGTAYGPEFENNTWRANVVHGGLHIRVVVGGLDDAVDDWSLLSKVKVITVMKDRA